MNVHTPQLLLRIELDDKVSLNLVVKILSLRHTNVLSREVLLVGFKPCRNNTTVSLLNNVLELSA